MKLIEIVNMKDSKEQLPSLFQRRPDLLSDREKKAIAKRVRRGQLPALAKRQAE